MVQLSVAKHTVWFATQMTLHQKSFTDHFMFLVISKPRFSHRLFFWRFSIVSFFQVSTEVVLFKKCFITNITTEDFIVFRSMTMVYMVAKSVFVTKILWTMSTSEKNIQFAIRDSCK